MITVHGIPSCDTVKAARAWIVQRGIEVQFRNFKTAPPTPEEVGRWADAVGWEVLLNRRGTTFRGLDDAERSDLDAVKAVGLMVAHPSLIKRPVIDSEGRITVGWTDAVRASFGG